MLIFLGLVLAGSGAALMWVRRTFTVVRVQGGSMAPAFHPGERVTVRRRPLAAVRVGDVVVLRRPPGPGAGGEAWLIKRVAALPGGAVPPGTLPDGFGPAPAAVPPGRLIVLGDDPANSRDSRHYGYLDAATILGVVRHRRREP